MIYMNERKLETVLDKVTQLITPSYFYEKEQWVISVIYDQKNKSDIWQAALELELAGEKVGYGFGSTMEETTKDVAQLLMKRDGDEQATYLSLFS